MFCNKCGHQFEGNFCPKCGAKAKNPPETPVNTTTFSEEKDDNPYDVYYKEQPQNPNVNKSEFGYQAPKQENAENFQRQQQPSQPYTPPYYQPQQPKDKKLKWWQILLFVLAGVLLGFAISPASCISSMLTYDETYLNEHQPYNNSKVGFIGDTINSEYFSYTLTDAKYIEESENKKPKDGYKFLEVTVKSVNTHNSPQWLEYELYCYADNIQYNDANKLYYYDFGNVLPMKASVNTVVFEIPESSTSVDIYMDDFYTNITIILNSLT